MERKGGQRHAVCPKDKHCYVQIVFLGGQCKYTVCCSCSDERQNLSFYSDFINFRRGGREGGGGEGGRLWTHFLAGLDED